VRPERPTPAYDSVAQPFELGAAHAMAVGDPRRLLVGSAILSTLWAAFVFSIFTGPVKQIKPLYDHAPWLNDPYDTVVSFAMFLVPLIAACCLVRVLLCRRFEPLPKPRVVDLLRGCQVVLAAISFTLLTEWIALAAGASRSAWDGATWLQVGALALLTILTARAVVNLRRAEPPVLDRGADAQPTSDWLTDMVVIVARQSHRLGPLRRPTLRTLSCIERRLIGVVRGHTLWSAALVCLAFGAAVGVNQGLREGYDVPSTLMAVVLLGCGMFGLLVGSGSYLGLVRSRNPLHGVRRRAVDAGVLACILVLVPFALRYHLWWIVGSRDAVAGIPQLAELLGIFAASIFIVVFAVESLLRLHSKTSIRPPRGLRSS
jgi:hypothetical protein